MSSSPDDASAASASETSALLRAPSARRRAFGAFDVSAVGLMTLLAALFLVASGVLLGTRGITRARAEPEPAIAQFEAPFVADPPDGAPATAAIVFLHGLGGGGGPDGVGAASALMPLPGVKWIFPGAPNRAVTAYGGRVVPAWYDMAAFSRSVTDMKDDERGLAESVAYVRGLVMDLVADGIPPGRIVLGGFSQGGAVAITAALSKMDDRFGGVGGGDEESAGGDDAPVTPPRLGGCFLLSSYLPLKDRYPSPMLRAGAEDTPVFIAHGREDTILPFYGFGWITGEKLKQFMTPGRVAFNEIPEMGHERLGEAEVTLLRDWLVRVLGP